MKVQGYTFVLSSLSRNTYQERLRDMALRRLDNLSMTHGQDKVSIPASCKSGADKSL